jgi:hypothetical protein
VQSLPIQNVARLDVAICQFDHIFNSLIFSLPACPAVISLNEFSIFYHAPERMTILPK